ncbi:MAG: hypothetical protein ACREI3_05575 [Nitrospirales bacterium]
MASYRSDLEKTDPEGLPPLADLEAGRPIGAILAMSERERTAVLETIELIDYYINQEEVTWS